MEFQIVCASWIKPEDEQVLQALAGADRHLTAAELAARTGLTPGRVARTLGCLEQQQRLWNGRKRLTAEAYLRA